MNTGEWTLPESQRMDFAGHGMEGVAPNPDNEAYMAALQAAYNIPSAPVTPLFAPLAGQDAAAWRGMPQVTTLPMAIDALPSSEMYSSYDPLPPMISVSAAPITSKDNDPAMAHLFGQAYPGMDMYPPGLLATHGRPMLPRASSDTQLFYARDSPVTDHGEEGTASLSPGVSHPGWSGVVPFVAQTSRPRDGTQSSLKLDVHMGFVGDGKNISPTMLQPTFGWKKRRSISDVGPRTPSMLGGPLDHFPASLESLPTRAEARDADQRASALHDASTHFASLNLQVDALPNHAPIPTSNHILTAQAPLERGDANAVSPITLDPILTQVLPDLTAPLLPMEAQESQTGPMRPTIATHTPHASRPVSPYHTPKRSSPDADRAGSEAAAQDTVHRMHQWRFPTSGVPQNDSLHPMDAYAHASHHPLAARKGARRHLRGAVSEDYPRRAPAKEASAWGYSVDLSERDFASVPPNPSEDNRSHSPEGAFWEAARESRRLHRVLPDTRSPTHARHASEQAIHMAAETKTPVVTTSAALAASASRRKAEALFVCPFPDCESTFTRQYNLRGHMRSHLDQRPFKCDWPGCGRSFARAHDCKRHVNLHLNVKPYTCEFCQKPFARLDALNRHHKVEGELCGQEDKKSE